MNISNFIPVFAPTAWPFANITPADLYTEFARAINATSYANLHPQNIHERAEVILLQPETILKLVLSFLALIANVLSVCATANIPFGPTTHSKLIISLALSDILVTISVFSHILNKVFNTAKIPPRFNPEDRLTSSCTFAFIHGLNTMAHLISLFNLAAMAMDHYLAILKPLRYSSLMSRKRGNIMITCLWILAIIGGFSNFLTGLTTYQEKANFINYCEVIMFNDFHGEYLVISTTFLCLIMISVIYGRIYCEVKKINTRLAPMQKDSLHNKKALVTTLLIIGTYIVCWLPMCIFQIAMIIQINIDLEVVEKFFTTLLKANKYLYALLILNSLIDPIIYAVRLRTVQLGYYRLLSKCCSYYARKYKHQSMYPSRWRGTQTKSTLMESDLRDDCFNGEIESGPEMTDINGTLLNHYKSEVNTNIPNHDIPLLNNNVNHVNSKPQKTEDEAVV